MMTAEEIKNIITNNRGDIAFVIGNGIHRYNNDEALSWEQLLIDLWRITLGDTNSITNKEGKLIKDISNTEFYDILEMKCKQALKKEFEDHLEMSKTLLTKHTTNIDKFTETIFRKITSPQTFSINDLANYNRVISVTESNIDWDKIEKVMQLRNAIHGLQLYISTILSRWNANDYHHKIASYLYNLNVPVLTTNYDNVLADAIGAELKRNREKNSHYYPWSSYYAAQTLNHPLEGFGIWHINGMVNYSTSIRLGLSQYMGSISKARKLIHKNSEELFVGKDQDNWAGKNTWLHIFFNRSLFIFGLALEENETFLRWLLIQRANYFNKFPDRKHEGWYLTRKKDIEKSPGKRFFLESVGIKILEVTEYKTIYESIWL